SPPACSPTPQFSPAAAPHRHLDQTQFRIKLVRSVYVHIDLLTFIQRGQWNPQAGGLLPRSIRGGNTANPQPILHLLAQQLNKTRRRRSCTQAEHLTIFDEPQTRPRRRFFFQVVGHKFPCRDCPRCRTSPNSSPRKPYTLPAPARTVRSEWLPDQQ